MSGASAAIRVGGMRNRTNSELIYKITGNVKRYISDLQALERSRTGSDFGKQHFYKTADMGRESGHISAVFIAD